jgi:hypothetical protein
MDKKISPNSPPRNLFGQHTLFPYFCWRTMIVYEIFAICKRFHLFFDPGNTGFSPHDKRIPSASADVPETAKFSSLPGTQADGMGYNKIFIFIPSGGHAAWTTGRMKSAMSA